jgi:hypothetical protein
MALVRPHPSRLDPASVAPLLADFGFLASPDLPDRPGPAYLYVALRAAPTLRHYDPEAVDYWVTEGERRVRRRLTRESRVPIAGEFSWGLIRIVDRLRVTNEYLTFGGRLEVDDVDGAVVAVFTSPAPLLRRGGHSQGWDQGADSLGAFFSRFLLAVDYSQGFESRAARAEPLTRYAAFVADATARCRASSALRSGPSDWWALLQAEERRIRAERPGDWAAGEDLRRDLAWSVERSGAHRGEQCRQNPGDQDGRHRNGNPLPSAGASTEPNHRADEAAEDDQAQKVPRGGPLHETAVGDDREQSIGHDEVRQSIGRIVDATLPLIAGQQPAHGVPPRSSTGR